MGGEHQGNDHGKDNYDKSRELPPEEGDLNTESLGRLSDDEKKWLKQDLKAVESGHSSSDTGYDEREDEAHHDRVREEMDDFYEEARDRTIEGLIARLREVGISEEQIGYSELHDFINYGMQVDDNELLKKVKNTLEEAADKDESIKKDIDSL